MAAERKYPARRRERASRLNASLGFDERLGHDFRDDVGVLADDADIGDGEIWGGGAGLFPVA